MKKKDYSYIGISFIILIFGVYVLPKVMSRFTSSSNLYKGHKVPNFEFVNQHNKKITNSEFKDKVYVVEFFFTTCPTICPLMNKQMVYLSEEFLLDLNFGIASISITPEIDTPKVLQNYAEAYGVQHKNWHLLTGKPSEYVYDLSNVGFKLYSGRSESSTSHSGFEHSGLFALVDKNGFIRSRYDEYGNPIYYYRALDENGFANQISELKEDIKVLLNE